MKWSYHPTPQSDATSLVLLAAKRLALGDMVAAAKFGSSMPINDGGREEQLLSDVGRRSREIGLDPEVSSRFFRAQIEANKVVQRRLHELWSAHPELKPTRTPNLEAELRPQLDSITTQMLLRLKMLEDTRNGAVPEALLLSEHVDELHADALRIALAPIRDRIGEIAPAPDEAWRHR